MKKLIAMLLALCLCAACFTVFAEDAKTDVKETDDKELENVYKFETYITIQQVLEALDLKDNDLYKEAEKETKPVYALAQYLLEKGSDVTDPAELAKKDELKEYADFFAGKMDLDPKQTIDLLLSFGAEDNDIFNKTLSFSFADSLLKFAYGLEVLGSEIEENDVIKAFKSILEEAEKNDDVKDFLAAIKDVMDGFLKDDEAKAKFKELAEIVSKVSADKLEAVAKEIEELYDSLILDGNSEEVNEESEEKEEETEAADESSNT